ncbi:MAG TPA: hypothetical protein VFG06_07070, partial [Thermodesulfovibrionales bacterium]|nr:hypothetical protein [Thermodesulfovibrionales bacterium]
MFAHILLTDYSLSNSVSQYPLFIKNETKIEKSGQVYLFSQRGHQTGMWYPREVVRHLSNRLYYFTLWELLTRID